MKSLSSLLFILCLFVTSAEAQKSFHYSAAPKAASANIFTASGKPFARQKGVAQEPKVIVDTVRIVAGFGSLKLQSSFGDRHHRTAPTSADRVFGVASGLATDSTKSVYSYSVVPRSKGGRLLIKSSGGASDTGKVAITVYVR